MSVATWHALCMDASHAGRLAAFWSAALGMSSTALDDGGYRLVNDDERVQIWVDPVPEPKTVKHRVHLDVQVGSLDGLHELGATALRPPTDEDEWWVMQDVEGGEFCAFLREGMASLPGHRLAVVVDSVDPYAQVAWWGEILGLQREREPQGHYAALETMGRLPFDYLCFVPVPEPKTAKNRIHWDVLCPDVDVLVARGARILREPDDEISWHIMADPEGNEFCAFAPHRG
ncbi:VOC family protein [Phytoactinopolyspora endophytica]|uniref:VOC family protein n=1 Tax=Phytoactinopolyspora endophytica TaxID=1642495 RepID=UPI00101B5B96|nr:VOC family protein [Phytoactinopolyspora endophytica]